MPVYEYKCTKCDKKFEVMQKITEDPLTVCSSCGGVLKKLITNTSFVLKGSGWYVTDYPSSDRGKEKKAEKPAGESKDTKSEPKTEPKTEPKKEAVNA
ncbi:MAG: zinc ribbon domain-containing protein [Nitrospirae bacterium]|nr:zinc ribbon domain-containing protein [Nitrospirota bacterium]